MQKRFRTIRDYHTADPDIRVQTADFQDLRVSILHEGSGDVRFARTDRSGLVLTRDGTAAHFTQMDGIRDGTPSRAGDVHLIPEGLDVHVAWRNLAAVQTSVMVEFDARIFQTYTPELATGRFMRGHLRPENYAQRPVIAHLMEVLAAEIDPATRRGRLYAEAAIRLLALEIAGSVWTAAPGPADRARTADARVARAIDFIEAHFARDISIVEIAAAAGLSPSQLTRVFHKATGQPPHAYVIGRRLDEAIQLLRTTDLPIVQIALATGFADQSHLTRAMRARRGRTPSDIRDA